MSFLFDQLKPTLAGLERAGKRDGNDLAPEAFAKLLQPPDLLEQRAIEAFVNLTAAEVASETGIQ